MRNESAILEAMLKGEALYADIFAEKRTFTHIQVESEKIEKLEKGLEQGVGLRVITPWKMFLASTTSQDAGHLLDLARDLGRASGEKAARQLGARRRWRRPPRCSTRWKRCACSRNRVRKRRSSWSREHNPKKSPSNA